MRRPRLAHFLAGLLGLTLAPIAFAVGLAFFGHPSWGNAIVATDTTPEGAKITPPTPDQPVYVTGWSLGNRLGSISGDDEPGKEQMEQVVARVLARQGYLRAEPGKHEPTLFLVLQWGYLTPATGDLLWFLGYNPAQDIASPAFPGQLGPEVFRRNMRSRMTDTVLEDSNEPIYGVIITAFEYKSARTPKPIVYWQTRIALPANGKSMAEALPAMLTAAQSQIGLASEKPTLVDTDRVRDGEVKAGEIKVIGVVPDDKPADTKK
ncbi:MAG TPA: hypothetical protein VHD32_01720 [Candidatus Didemnitutus sp.]|nr:hypothetical protein [Candidatus Didemnitutus sp.]